MGRDPALGERDPALIAGRRGRVGGLQAPLDDLAQCGRLLTPVGIDLEARVETCFEWMGREQTPAPRVDRLHDEVIESATQSAGPRDAAILIGQEIWFDTHRQPRLLDLAECRIDASGHLGRCRLGEGDRDGAAENARGHTLGCRPATRSCLLGEQRLRPLPPRPEAPGHDPRDESGRLTRARAGLEDERRGELALGQGARRGIRESECSVFVAHVSSVPRRHRARHARSAGPNAPGCACSAQRPMRSRAPESPR